MNDILNVLKNRHTELCKKREGVISNLVPLENQRKILDEKIETIEHLILLEGKSDIPKEEPRGKIEIKENKNNPKRHDIEFVVHAYTFKSES